MADDIASLGFAVDSSPVDRARDSLGRLASTAKQAQTAAEGFAAGSARVSKSAGTFETALARRLADYQQLSARLAETGHLSAIGKAFDETGAQAALSSHQLANLSFQLNDIATQAALGVSPFRILATQFGQVYQVLQTGGGGVTGSLRYLGERVGALITPTRLAGVAIGGIAVAGTAAASSWRSTEAQIGLALTGIGAAAGVTAADIYRIADAAGRSGVMTVSAARDMALAFASTGKIGASTAAELIKLSEATGRLFGEDAIAGAARLAKAFSDPAKGVDELNERLAVFDAATRQRIISLTAQNRVQEAQNLLIRGSSDAIRSAGSQVGTLERLWSRAAAAVDDYLARAGGAIDRGLGGGTLEDQLRAAQQQLAKASQVNFLGLKASPEFIAEITARIADLTDKLQKLNKAQAEAPANQRSLAISEAVRAALPDIAALEDATNALERLKRATLDPAAFSRLPAADQANLQRAIQLRAEEADSIKLKIANQRTSLELAREDNDFALAAINARTAAERAELAYRQTLAREERAGNTAAKLVAAGAAAQVLAEENRQVTDEIRSRNFAAQQSIELAQLELSLVGKTADEAARLTAAFQARQQVLASAFESNRAVSPAELADADQNARRLVAVESKIRRDQFMADLEFERQQIGRSPTEQSIYARLQSAGLLENGAIVSAQDQAIAGRIRLNEELQRSVDIQRDFASTFLHGMLDAKSATEALGDAFGRLGSKILDNSLDTLFAGLSRSGAVPTGGIFGGNILPGILHDGGVAGSGAYPRRSVPAGVFAGARRYHSGGLVGLKSDEVPAILQKGEVVLPRGAQSGGETQVIVQTTIDARGAYPESIEQIKAAIARRDAELPGKIVNQMRIARDRRIA